MKSLLKYFKGYLWETFLGPVFKLLEAIFELCVPLIIAHLVDQVIPKKETSAVVMTAFFEGTDYCLWSYHHGLHHQS